MYYKTIDDHVITKMVHKDFRIKSLKFGGDLTLSWYFIQHFKIKKCDQSALHSSRKTHTDYRTHWHNNPAFWQL